MKRTERLRKEIETLTSDLITVSLCIDQNPPISRTVGKRTAEITFAGHGYPFTAMKNISYADAYAELSSSRAYNFKMIDGALLQLQYTICDDDIGRHRLAFFPAPDLSEYQNNPEIYDDDELYADVIDRNIVATPVRFDFDREAFMEIEHPMSHLSIGQYRNCRIPVSGPVSPYFFLAFVLRSFYNTGFRRCCREITAFPYEFGTTIAEAERGFIHVHAPVSVSKAR